jgi:hypothetical protein
MIQRTWVGLIKKKNQHDIFSSFIFRWRPSKSSLDQPTWAKSKNHDPSKRHNQEVSS